jgi:hypothetical protein
MRLKAIASPGEQAQGLAVALSQARKRRRSNRPRRGSVLDAVRLRHTACRAALEGAYVLEDRPATRSFSRPGPRRAPAPRRNQVRPGRSAPRATQARRHVGARASTVEPMSAGACRRAMRSSLRCSSAGAMASATGHRCRNLWPDREESPGHPGGSGHRSRSRDREKSLLRRGYARLVPCSMVRKGSSVRVRQRALAKCLHIGGLLAKRANPRGGPRAVWKPFGSVD